MAALARVAKSSAARLRVRFRQCFHLPPMRFTGRVRLHAAAHRLGHTAMPIVDVASETGFRDQNHIRRQFSRCFGASPEKDRQQRGRS